MQGRIQKFLKKGGGSGSSKRQVRKLTSKFFFLKPKNPKPLKVGVWILDFFKGGQWQWQAEKTGGGGGNPPNPAGSASDI